MSGNFVEIIEVSPRDGIQNDKTILSTDVKLELIRRAVDAGADRVEATSFVNPKRVSQMADADEVAAALPHNASTKFIGLTLNRRGFDRAVAAGLDEANFVVVATDSFNQRNQGVPTEDSIRAFGDIMATAEPNIKVGVTIGAAFGCPFEGEVPVARLMQVVETCVAHRPHEIGLADTIGVAVPADIKQRVSAVRNAFPDIPVRLHLHNTRNTGIANAWAGIEAGVRSLDASFGGVGGCPFAPRATGNIATEDLLYMLERSGVQTNMSLDAAIETAGWLEAQLGQTLPGQVMKAGSFPKPHADEAAA
ncbi:MAG: hydroxymethylglutaryl-CoA lyase [Pseudomonadota bacterium]